MALFIRDETVDRLASDVQRVLNTPTKKEAVRLALQHQLDQASQKRPLMEAIAELQAKAAALGPENPDFDMKRFTDEMWGDI